MSTPWLHLFVERMEELIRPDKDAILRGNCEDYLRYRVCQARVDAFTRALEIAKELDRGVLETGARRGINDPPPDDREI